MKNILSILLILFAFVVPAQKFITVVKTSHFDQSGGRIACTTETIRVCSENVSSIETDGSGCILMLKSPQKLDGGTITGYVVTQTQDQLNTAINATAASVAASAGLVSAPSIAWADEAASGWYRIGSNNYGFAVNGTKVFEFASTGLTAQVLSTLTNLTTTGAIIHGGTAQTLTGAGAVNLTTHSTLLVTTAADALTLAAGSEGQYKFIRMKTDGGDGTLTVTNLQGGTTITFNDAGDFVHLYYRDAKWHILTNSGCTVA